MGTEVVVRRVGSESNKVWLGTAEEPFLDARVTSDDSPVVVRVEFRFPDKAMAEEFLADVKEGG